MSAEDFNPQSAIRNPQSAIRNPQSKHRFVLPSQQSMDCQDLFIAQRNHGVDAAGAAPREPEGHKRDDGQQNRDAREDQRILRMALTTEKIAVFAPIPSASAATAAIVNARL